MEINWIENDNAEIFKEQEWMGRVLKHREAPEKRTLIFGRDKQAGIGVYLISS
jgi:hypothetical protein